MWLLHQQMSKNQKNLYWSSLSRQSCCKFSLNCNYYSGISVVCLVIVVVSNVGELRSVRRYKRGHLSQVEVQNESLILLGEPLGKYHKVEAIKRLNIYIWLVRPSSGVT